MSLSNLSDENREQEDNVVGQIDKVELQAALSSRAPAPDPPRSTNKSIVTRVPGSSLKRCGTKRFNSAEKMRRRTT